MPHRKAHRIVLNMTAITIASNFTGNQKDDEYVLERVRQILRESVYEDAPANDDQGVQDDNVVQLSIVS